MACTRSWPGHGHRSGTTAARRPSLVWTANDALVAVDGTELQRRVGGRAWATVARGRRLTTARTRLTPGKGYAFRVRSADHLGNTSLSRPLSLRLTVRNSSSTKWLLPASAWRTATDGHAIGDSLLTTREAKSSLSTKFNGSALAVVAPIGPRHGEMRVRVDGGPWQRVALKARRNAGKRVVFSQRLEPGDHAIEVQARRGLAALDALLILD